MDRISEFDMTYVSSGSKYKYIIDALTQLNCESPSILAGLNIFINNDPDHREVVVSVTLKCSNTSFLELSKSVDRTMRQAGMGLAAFGLDKVFERLGDGQYNHFSVTPKMSKKDIESAFSQIVISDGNVKFFSEYTYVNPGYKKVFISYSSEHSSDVRLLVHRLQALGLAVWVDFQRVDAGDDIAEKIDDGISDAAVCFMWVSKKFLTSDYCINEMKAMRSRRFSQSTEILAVRDSGIDVGQLPPFLQRLHVPTVGSGDIVEDVLGCIMPKLSKLLRDEVI